MDTEKTEKLKQALSAALDVLWIEYGNGFGTEKEKLISEIQMELERIESPNMKDEERRTEGSATLTEKP